MQEIMGGNVSMRDDLKVTEHRDGLREVYEAPRLYVIGSFQELTAAKTSTPTDAGGHHTT
jgi:hypothetical protein